MLFLNILENIQKIKQLSTPKIIDDNQRNRIQDILKTLFNALQVKFEKNSASAESYLKKALIGYGLKQVLAPDYDIDENFPINPTLEQKITPLCELAWLYEQNGEAHKHAHKLAAIFKDEKAVFNYLIQFGQGKSYRALLHDACLFSLPENCNFTYWKNLANAQNNMLNAGFRKLLPHAKTLEQMLIPQEKKKAAADDEKKSGNIISNNHPIAIDSAPKDKKQRNAELKALKIKWNETNKEKKIIQEQALSELEKKLNAAIKDYKKVENYAQNDLLTELRLKEHEARIELAELCLELPLHELTVFRLKALYELYVHRNNKKGLEILGQNGLLSEKNIEIFQSITRCNNDAAIPNILIDGNDIGYPNVYLKKLDTLSDEGVATALSLGIMTSCCQFAGGAGEDCAKHGISSPNGGFYTLYSGNADSPDIKDKILTQGWIWKGRRGGLCLDSAEPEPTTNTEIAVDMYRYLGILLCDPLGPYKIPHITIGSASGISNQVGLAYYSDSYEYPIDYFGYRDSKKQLILASSTMPYIFYGKVKSQKLQQIIQQRSEELFRVIFENTAPLKNNEPLKQATALGVHEGNEELLAALKQCAGDRHREFDALVETNRNYLLALTNNVINFEDLDEGAFLNVLSWNSESALRVAILNKDKAAALRLIKLGIHLNIQDIEGNTVLHYLADNPEFLTIILEAYSAIYSKSQIQDALLIANADEQTLLHLAARYPASLAAILAYIREDQRLDVVKFVDKNKQTVLHLAAHYPDSLTAILVPLPQDQRQDAVKIVDNNQETVLHLAASNPDSLTAILTPITQNKRQDVVKVRDIHQKTVLHLAAYKPDSLTAILTLILQDQRLNLVKLVDRHGDTVLHLAAYNPAAITAIFALLSKEQRREALRLTDRFNNTVLFKATQNLDALKSIVAFIPEDEILNEVIQKDNKGIPLLHKLKYNLKALTAFLAYIPEEQRLDAIKVTDPNDNNLLHQVDGIPEALTVILASLPKTQRLAAILTTDKYGNNVLHRAADNPDSVKAILAALSRPERLIAIDAVNKNGKTLKELAEDNSDSLQALESLLKEVQVHPYSFHAHPLSTSGESEEPDSNLIDHQITPFDR